MTSRVLGLLRSCWRRLRGGAAANRFRIRSRLLVEELESRLVPATLTILADADARVQLANPATNYGTATELSTDLSPERETFLRFSVTGVTGTVQSAKVRVNVTGSTSNGPAIYTTATSWVESGAGGITWNNRPARIGGPFDDRAAVGTGWQEFNVTPAVAGNGIFSFVLAATSTDGLYMASRERAGLAPQLVVITDAPTALGASAGPDRVTQEATSITFAGSASGGVAPLSYLWDFGDTQTASGTLSPSHVYANSGAYTVRLTVTDAAGATATDTAEVTVNEPAPSSAVCRSRSAARQIGTLNHSLIDESSGMAVSRVFPNRIYHNNDSGDGGFFYISNFQGGNTQRVQVTGFTPVDAEDMAYGSFGGKNYLMIGDIGDNAKSRTSLTLVVIEEQASYGAAVAPAFKITFKYPDGAHNAEGMALHPNGDLYILTKENPSKGYRLTAAQWQNTTGQTQTMQFVGQFTLASQTGSSSITAFDISPDGSRLLVLTYSGMLELEARFNNGVLDFSQYTAAGGAAYTVIKPTKLPQQESASYLPDGHDFIYSSEYHGSAVPILEVDCLD